MTNEIKTLLPATSTPGNFTGTQQKGAGYQTGYDSLHTIVFYFKNWSGEVKIQATLSLYPGDDDWFDLKDTDDNDAMLGDGSTDYDDSYTINVKGRFVWLRAIGTINSGEITEIRYNY